MGLFPTSLPRREKISWLIHFSPEYSFGNVLPASSEKSFFGFDYNRVLENNSSASQAVDIVRLSFPRWQFSGGLGLEYALSKNWHIQTGIGISHTSSGIYQIDSSPLDIYGEPGPNVVADNNFTLKTQAMYNTTQLEIPLMVNYHLRRGLNTWIFSLGGAVNRTFNGKYGPTLRPTEDALISNANFQDRLNLEPVVIQSSQHRCIRTFAGPTQFQCLCHGKNSVSENHKQSAFPFYRTQLKISGSTRLYRYFSSRSAAI